MESVKFSPRNSLDKSISFLGWIIYFYSGRVDSWVEVYGIRCITKWNVQNMKKYAVHFMWL